ncbi:DUF4157 domain-containing protein [Phormidium tenue FACHB-886]|nr:DUF4157 domain-containing protein [Phormidium tenue FACHB-886]
MSDRLQKHRKSPSIDPAPQAVGLFNPVQRKAVPESAIAPPIVKPPQGFDFRNVSVERPPEQGDLSDRPSTSSIQPKLTVSQPDDPYEQEADRVANEVMRMQDPRAMEQGLVMRSRSEALQRQWSDSEEEDELMRKSSEAGEIGEGAIEQVNRAVRSGGQPLDQSTRDFMEPRFGHDFSQVRIHADSQASDSAQAIHARAYATGEDIVFASGQYSPGTDAGKRLLAHELTHVVQQTGGGSLQSHHAGKLQADSSPQAMQSTLNAPNKILQRDESQSAGQPTPQGTSTPTPTPVENTATPEQTEARQRIDTALQDFSQAAFKAIKAEDWSAATSAEKLKLIDRATGIDLSWVGPNDEASIAQCWASFGQGFEAVVEANPILWSRSIWRGVDPDAIPQTKGKYDQFKQDVLAVVSDNLTKNEDRIVAEMAEFGLTPPANLLRPGHPGAREAAALNVTGSSPNEKLKEQARLAKIALNYKNHLNELKKVQVGLDQRKFDPGNPTEDSQDLVIYQGMTSWQWLKSEWDKVTAEMALIFNAWPALYAADLQGTLEVLASQSYDKVPESGLPADIAGAQGQVQSGLEPVKKTFHKTLENIQAVRSNSSDPLDFPPVHHALFSGKTGSRKWSGSVYLPIINDERQLKDDVAAAAKFGMDAISFAVMLLGPIGTLAGAAIAIGAAGASALQSRTRATELAAAHGASIGQDTELVTKEAVTAAEAEAHNKEIELGIAVIMNVVPLGVEAAAAQLKQAKMREVGGENTEGFGGLRSKLRSRQQSPEAKPSELEGAEEGTTEPEGETTARDTAPGPMFDKFKTLFSPKPWTEPEVLSIVSRSRGGQQALQIQNRYKVRLAPHGTSSFFEPIPGDTVYLAANQSSEQAAINYIHEMIHVEWHHTNLTVNTRIKTVSRAEYVERMLLEEATAQTKAIQVKYELQEQGGFSASTPLEREYDKAYKAAEKAAVKEIQKREAGKFKKGSWNPEASGVKAEVKQRAEEAGFNAVIDGFRSGRVTNSVDGKTYPDYYGKGWDKANP